VSPGAAVARPSETVRKSAGIFIVVAWAGLITMMPRRTAATAWRRRNKRMEIPPLDIQVFFQAKDRPQIA